MLERTWETIHVTHREVKARERIWPRSHGKLPIETRLVSWFPFMGSFNAPGLRSWDKRTEGPAVTAILPGPLDALWEPGARRWRGSRREQAMQWAKVYGVNNPREVVVQKPFPLLISSYFWLRTWVPNISQASWTQAEPLNSPLSLSSLSLPHFRAQHPHSPSYLG